jgi:hypothetical protein
MMPRINEALRSEAFRSSLASATAHDGCYVGLFPHLPDVSLKDVDARDKRGHDASGVPIAAPWFCRGQASLYPPYDPLASIAGLKESLQT